MTELRANNARRPTPIPASAGIGFRGPHYSEIAETLPAVGWLEAHSENYFGAGGAPLHYLEKCREHYPLSLHGVGLSLGSVDPLSKSHLKQLRGLIDRFEPGLVSEHLSWGSIDGNFFNDLLPVPYTEEALAHFCQRVDEAQHALGTCILVENPSSYLSFDHSNIPEWEFFVEVSRRTDCGLLVDINNIYVSACNHGFDARQYIEYLPADRVGEIHLAGHAVNSHDGVDILIDDHGSAVGDAVWELFQFAMVHFGHKPVLIERDSNIPPLSELVNEAAHAQAVLDNLRANVA
ncbi:MAG: DUF692 domain-containing protein [Pseudomonadota bacterium]